MTLSAPDWVIDRARKIKIIVFDVDGVWTDGTIWLVPGRPSAEGGIRDDIRGAHNKDIGFGVQSDTLVEVKGYSAHDGMGISLARMAGLKCGVITKRISETVATRARDLKIEYVYQGQAFKMKPMHEICENAGATLDEICYVGDDIIDLPVMRKVGFAVAVANARERVKTEAHYVTPNRGGYGAARDAIEFILEAKGVLDRCIESYLDESTSIAPSMDVGRGGEDLPSRQ
ncbi:MAG TPA: HAD hydrolase family protein [Terracidiphilus sp.]|jgi:3-deoxy-D-manno-octulosonate 8-phosphate phosphatase (KDO 8-P phosphatase)